MIQECYGGNDAVTSDMRYDKVVMIMSGLEAIVRKYNWEPGISVLSVVALRPFTWNSGDVENELYKSTTSAAFSRISR